MNRYITAATVLFLHVTFLPLAAQTTTQPTTQPLDQLHAELEAANNAVAEAAENMARVEREALDELRMQPELAALRREESEARAKYEQARSDGTDIQTRMDLSSKYNTLRDHVSRLERALLDQHPAVRNARSQYEDAQVAQKNAADALAVEVERAAREAERLRLEELERDPYWKAEQQGVFIVGMPIDRARRVAKKVGVAYDVRSYERRMGDKVIRVERWEFRYWIPGWADSVVFEDDVIVQINRTN